MPRDHDNPSKPAPRRTDWEAIERDYRTGRFTLRELELRHGRSASQICRRAQGEGWTKDLREVVRRATSAGIIRDLAGEAATSAQADTTAIVLAAAQAQRDVILQHRKDCALARSIATALLAELSEAGAVRTRVERLLAQVPDALDERTRAALLDDLREIGRLHLRVGSMQRLADTLQRLHQLERRAFGIGDDEDSGADPLGAMSEVELQAEISRLEVRLQRLEGPVAG